MVKMKEGEIMERDKEWIRERMRREENTKKSGKEWDGVGWRGKRKRKENVYDSQVMNELHWIAASTNVNCAVCVRSCVY